jgi:aminoglycoside phosphotransferase (APT) family kinase protein
MEPPPFPDVTDETLHAIATQNGLDADEFALLPETGLFNRIYRFGDDLILRISRVHPRAFEIARREAIAVPLGRAAGMRTPALLVCDLSGAVIPAPYTIYERVRGETLGLLDLEPNDTPEVWRELGRDLALLHAHTAGMEPPPELDYDDLPDPRPWPDELASAGLFSASEARWLSGWLDRLSPAVLAPVPRCLRHGDTQTTNVMVRAGSLEYLAVIDWGSAQWGDPAYDLAGIPFRAMPYLLQGHREVVPLAHDETAEARILWRHLTLALHNLWREPQPERSWAERPLTHLLDVLRFLIENPDSHWYSLLF